MFLRQVPTSEPATGLRIKLTLVMEDGTTTTITPSFQNSPAGQAEEIADDVDALEGYEASTSNGVIHIRTTDGSPFTVQVAGYSESQVMVIQGRADSISDLPTVAPLDYTVRIAGDAGTNLDEYYVRFEALNNIDIEDGFGQGHWVETTGPTDGEFCTTALSLIHISEPTRPY